MWHGIMADWRKAESVWCSASLCPTSSDWLPLSLPPRLHWALAHHMAHWTHCLGQHTSLPPSPLFACLVSYGQHLAIRNCLILSPSCITVTADCFFSQVCRGRLGLGIAVSGDSHLSQMKGQDGMISNNILQLK